MKVPIEVENDEVTPDETDVVEEDERALEADAYDELTPEEEAAMVEAAKRAGAEAAERDMAADADRIRSECEELRTQLADATDQIETAKKEASDASDKFLRLQADWDNYRRRTAQERLAERERAAEKLVTNLLPVLDDMERASAHAVATADGDEKILQFVEGIDAVHAKMLDILSHENVEAIDPTGEAFNPLEHQAVGRVDDPSVYDETVAQVYQRGYRMGGKIIRAAMVTVAYGGPKRPAEEAEEAEE